MFSKKVWALFLLFFLLSFSQISFNFKYESNDDRNATLKMIENFVHNQVSKEQINTNKPVKWQSSLLYSIELYGDDLTSKQKERLTENLLSDLSAVTKLPLKRVEPEKANLKFIFAPDWRNSLIKHYPEIKNNSTDASDMNDEEYKNFWMAKKQNTYMFRGVKSATHEIIFATLFFNNEFENDNCEISVNIARALMLAPEKEFSYINTCLKDSLPVLEEAFLKVFYSKEYDKFLEQHATVNYEKVIDFFVKEIYNSIDESITFEQN